MTAPSPTRKLVIIESPYAGRTPELTARNERFAQACLLDSIRRDEAPFASHLLYTQVLDDKEAEDRKTGMACGFAWLRKAELIAVYDQLGTSVGMQLGITVAKRYGIPIEHRRLPGFADWLKKDSKRS